MALLSLLTESAWPLLVAEAVVKCSVLLLVAMASAWLLRGKSPALRAWLLHLPLLAVLPVFLLTLGLPVSPWAAEIAVPEATDFTPLLHEVNVMPQRLSHVQAMPVESHPPAVEMSSPVVSWPLALFWIWAAGAVVRALWILGRHMLFCLRRRALVEVHRGRLVDALAAECGGHGIPARPRLYLSAGWAMPATWGVLRPAILLPREAAGWTMHRLRHVLLHELAHIRRKDVLLAGLAAPAEILLWFHPLLWMAHRALAQAREAACDDWVLTDGKAGAAAYSADLLAIVRRHSSPLLAAGMAMARSGNVAARIHRLVDDSSCRAPLTRSGRWGITAAGTALTACVLALVSCRTGSTAPPASGGGSAVLGNPASKPAPGDVMVSYNLIEITWTSGAGSPLETLLSGDLRHAIPMTSMYTLSGQRGVDLVTLGRAKEGRTVSMETKTLSAKISGVRARGESRILTDADISFHPGVTPARSPLTVRNLRIPDGGYVVLPFTRRTLPYAGGPQTIVSALKQFFQPQETISMLALGARSDKGPPSTSRELDLKMLPGDASIPRGMEIIQYETRFINHPSGKPWGVELEILARCSPAELKRLMEKAMLDRDASTVSYPHATSVPDCPVTIRSMAGGKGMEIILNAGKSKAGGLWLDCEWNQWEDITRNLKQSSHHAHETFPASRPARIVNVIPSPDQKTETLMIVSAEAKNKD